jgi:hypothetical protein
MLTKSVIHGLDEDVEVKIWDINTKTIVDTAPSMWEASNKLGVNINTVQRSCAKRTNFYSPVKLYNVACRLGKKNAIKK